MLEIDNHRRGKYMAKVELTIPDKFSKIDPELREKLLSGAL